MINLRINSWAKKKGIHLKNSMKGSSWEGIAKMESRISSVIIDIQYFGQEIKFKEWRQVLKFIEDKTKGIFHTNQQKVENRYKEYYPIIYQSLERFMTRIGGDLQGTDMIECTFFTICQMFNF